MAGATPTRQHIVKVALVATVCLIVIIFLLPAVLHFCYAHLTAVKNLSNQECSATNISHSIPKVIHQTWKTLDIPKKWQAFRKTCEVINPEYQIRTWSHDLIYALLKKHYPWFIPTFDSYQYPVQKAEAGRYFIIYHYGGIYLDMDVSCKVAINEILSMTLTPFDVMLDATYPVGLTNNIIVAKPRHPFMKMMIESLHNSNHDFVIPHWTIMISTGPLYAHRTYLRYPCKNHIHVLPVHKHTTFYSDDKSGSWHTWDGLIFRVVDASLVFITPHWLPCLCICVIIYCLPKMNCMKWPIKKIKKELHKHKKLFSSYLSDVFHRQLIHVEDSDLCKINNLYQCSP